MFHNIHDMLTSTLQQYTTSPCSTFQLSNIHLQNNQSISIVLIIGQLKPMESFGFKFY